MIGRIKNMIQELVEKIAPSQLTAFFWWFTILSILIPILGAVVGGAFVIGSVKINDRITQLKEGAYEQRLSSSDKKVIDTQQQLTDTQKQLEETSRRAKELEKKQRPRNITSKQKEDFIKFLEYSQKNPIGIICQTHDNETDNYIHQVRSLLDDAGYAFTGPKNIVTYMSGLKIDIRIDSSIALIFPDARNPPPYAMAMKQAFESIGIKLAIIPEESVRKAIVQGDALIFISERR